jgi:hypothetical protein
LSGYLSVLAVLFLTLFATISNAQTACKVTYTISPQNSSAFGAAITIQNTGTTSWTSWTLTWAFANGQTVSSLWNGIETQSGANVTVKNEPYNGSVAASGTVSGVGFNGTWNGVTNAVPTSFAVNGTTCGATTGSFTLKPSAATLSIAQGASATDTITVTDVSPFAGSVTLAASGLPTGVTAAFATNPTTSTSVLTLTASSTATLGSSTVTITGTSGTLTATTTIALTVTAKPSFTLTVPPMSITQGKTASETITVTDIGGFSGSVTPTLTGLPSGVTCTFSPNPITTTSVMTCTATATATVGTATMTITGTSGTTTATTTFPLTVVSSSTGSFSLKPSAATLSIAQGASGTDTITVTDVSPFASGVTLAVSGLPTGVTATIGTNPATSTSVITFTVASTAAAATSTITITGTSGTLTATTTIALTVTASWSISSSCGSGLSVQAGSSNTCTITVTGTTATPTISLTGLPTGVTASIANPSSGTYVITLTASSSATAGTYTITVSVTVGTVTKTITIPFTITVPVTANAVVTVNPSNTGVAVSNTILGMNLASWYDVIANDAGITSAFETAGIKAVRWPGGSWSDIYHWSTNTNCFSSSDGAPAANDTFANFVSDIVTPAGLDVSLTADYGTNAACTAGGDPTEAASWAAQALTLKANVSHITVGNEEYGTWEEDLHSPAHDPTTYANAVATGYYPDIKAASPNVLVGVLVQPDYTWDSIVLANAKYDFVEFHYYPETPGSENDTTLIQTGATGLTTYINKIKTELTTAGHSGTPIYVGEIGGPYSNPGKQSWSITQGLYAGQVLGEMMNDGVTRLTWWIGFGNCNGQAGNDGSSVYGWQNFGAYNVFSDGPSDPTCPSGSTAPDWGPIGTISPTGRAFQLFSQVAVNGEKVLTPTVTGDTTDVVAYAATHSGGTALVLFNRNETTSQTVQVTVTGVTSAAGVTETTYNKALYDETDATTPVWAAPTTTSLGTVSLPMTLTLTPWSMNVVIIP